MASSWCCCSGDGGCDALGAAASADLLPRSHAGAPAGDVIAGARDVTLHTADGLELGAWFVPATGPVDTGMAVLVAPGNGGNRAGRAEFAEELSRRGLAVLLMDYRGYGGNPGSPSQDGLAADADAAAGAMEELGYPPQRTIYFGESLGSAVVAALQVRHPPAGIVLRSPFTELADVGAHHYPWLPVRALLRDRFPVVEHLATSDVSVTVIYGDRDSVVPPVLSARVADHAPLLGRASGDRGFRPQRPRHVRLPSGRRGRAAGARRGLKSRTPMRGRHRPTSSR